MTQRTTRRLLIVLVMSVGIAGTVPGAALDPSAWMNPVVPPAPDDTAGKDDEKKKKKEEKKKKKEDKPGKLIGVPIPQSNPTLGSGLALAGLYLRKLNKDDKVLRPSTFGVGVFYLTSGSWGAGLGARMYLKEDRHRPMFGLGVAQLNYDFYGIGNSAGDSGRFIPIEQGFDFAMVEWMFKVRKHFYLGPHYSWLDSTTQVSGSSTDPNDPMIPPRQLDAVTAALALHMEWDTRDNDFSATKGSKIDLVASVFDDAFGSDFDFESYKFGYSRYISIGGNDKHIIVPHATACDVTGSAPFFEICSVGGAFRGYPGGRYRDDTAVSAQAEFRWQMIKHFGMVFFGGGAAIAPDFGSYSDSTLLPSVGLGVRYMIVPTDRINIRVDYAWGKDSSALYISVGEAF